MAKIKDAYKVREGLPDERKIEKVLVTLAISHDKIAELHPSKWPWSEIVGNRAEVVSTVDVE